MYQEGIDEIKKSARDFKKILVPWRLSGKLKNQKTP